MSIILMKFRGTILTEYYRWQECQGRKCHEDYKLEVALKTWNIFQLDSVKLWGWSFIVMAISAPLSPMRWSVLWWLLISSISKWQPLKPFTAGRPLFCRWAVSWLVKRMRDFVLSFFLRIVFYMLFLLQSYIMLLTFHDEDITKTLCLPFLPVLILVCLPFVYSQIVLLCIFSISIVFPGCHNIFQTFALAPS